MARPPFTVAETMVIVTTVAVTLAIGRALDFPLVAHLVCVIMGLFGFAMLIVSRR